MSPACKQGTREQLHDTLETVGKELSVTFPAGSKLIGVRRERGIDHMVAAKVEIPAAGWPAFLASTPIDSSGFEPGGDFKLGPDQGFWDPGKVRNLRTAEEQLPNARFLVIGYDDSRGSVVVAYVINDG